MKNSKMTMGGKGWSGRKDAPCGPVSMVKKPGMLPKAPVQSKMKTTGSSKKRGMGY